MGKFENQTFTPLDQKLNLLDFGPDFYALQTLTAKDGRLVLISWMQTWGRDPWLFGDNIFSGIMTLPRQIKLNNLAINMVPIEEVASLKVSSAPYLSIVSSIEPLIKEHIEELSELQITA